MFSCFCYSLYVFREIRKCSAFQLLAEAFYGSVLRFRHNCLVAPNRRFALSETIFFLLLIGTDQMIPQVLEVNFCADCERACRYHPEFFNYIFSLLFLGDSNGWPVEAL